MDTTKNATDTINITLRQLLIDKSRRDKINFTSSKLATALDVPRSLIQRLIHPDVSKRVTNPKVETLLKIVDFFRTDGFDITLDDFLGIKRDAVDVESQDVGLLIHNVQLPLYTLNGSLKESMGSVEIKLAEKNDDYIALYADEYIKPMFKQGSIFIINCNMKPENDTLVAVRLDNEPTLLIRKFYRREHQQILESYDSNNERVILSPTRHYNILGVVVQVNAKT